jgi:hypothetical protein
VAPDAAVAAYGNPAFYEGRPPRDDISLIGVVGHEESASQVLIEIRYQFIGSVSSAVRAIIDPAKLSWLTRTEIQKEERRARFTIIPDHYPDRLECSGTFRFLADAAGTDATSISIEGDLTVHVFLVGPTVEQLVVSGLRSYLAAEIAGLPDFMRTA